MADLETFEGLFAEETEAAILIRWREWANEGLDPAEDVDEWVDTREGAHWWLNTTPGRREFVRLYDKAGTEVPASAFPQWSWGGYLDAHARLRQLDRLTATFAEGEETFVAPEGTVINVGTVVAIERTDPDADAVEYATTDGGTIDVSGSIDLPIRALVAGRAGNAGTGAVTQPVTPIPGLISLTNAAPIEGGTDEETDDSLRVRVLESYVGAAVANQLYYRRLLLNQPGIGRVTVIPAGNGPGTILIIVSTIEGDPVAADVLAAAQELVDPVAGQGLGDGQVGATITVATATTLPVAVAANIEFESGYSLDGDGNTTPLRDAIEALTGAYVDSVQSGEELVYERVKGLIATLRGVHDISGVTINGGTVNIAIPAGGAPKVPSLTLPMTLAEV